jgi:hypothetical protein
MTTHHDSHTSGSNRGLWIGLAIGAPIMVYGALELLSKVGSRHLAQTGEWIAGGLLAHDLAVAPTLIALVWVAGQTLPSRARTAVRAGTLGTILVLAIGGPALLGYGNRPDNPTVHPLDYPTAVLTSIAIVWGLVALGQLAFAWRHHQGPSTGRSTRSS